MRFKPVSRPDPSVRSGGCAQLDRQIPGYRQYLLDRGNAAGYLRNCEAAMAHLSNWMKDSNKRRCATSARHPSTIRAALGHLLVVLRTACKRSFISSHRQQCQDVIDR